MSAIRQRVPAKWIDRKLGNMPGATVNHPQGQSIPATQACRPTRVSDTSAGEKEMGQKMGITDCPVQSSQF